MPASDRTPYRLPGVGEQLDVRAADGERLTAIRHIDGDVELYVGKNVVVRLAEVDARQLGAFLSGHYVLPTGLADRMGDVLGGLRFDWMRLSHDAFAVGRTVGELQVRQRTGATIVAVLRGSIPITAVDPTTVLLGGDDIVYTCPDRDQQSFIDYLTKGR